MHAKGMLSYKKKAQESNNQKSTRLISIFYRKEDICCQIKDVHIFRNPNTYFCKPFDSHKFFFICRGSRHIHSVFNE